MNKSIRKVAIALAVLFAALFVNLNFVQVVKGDQYRNDPRNGRVLLDEFSSPRGDIIVDGQAIAHSRRTNDSYKYLRVYPDGKVYAPVTGFYSLGPLTSSHLGTGGIETAENSVLSGDDPKLFTTRLTDLLTGRNLRGGSVELTLDRATQEQAYKSLATSATGAPRSGAVVALDPRTGAVLAAVSSPSYDPSDLSLHNVDTVDTTYGKLLNNSTMPLLNRAFNQPYPPGSTFKVIVSAAALKRGLTPSTVLPAPNGYYPDSNRTAESCPSGSTACVENFDGETCYDGHTATLEYAFAKSCNTLFSALAVQRLHGAAISDEAAAFGFQRPYVGRQPDLCLDPQLTIPLPVCASTPGSRADLAENGYLARTAFGQQDSKMTVLQGAMLAGAVADNGLLMQPYLVDRELAPNLDEIEKTSPSELGQVLNQTQAGELQQMMQAVVSQPEGTAYGMSVPGAVVGGKTGTADTGRTLPNGQDEPPDAWFVGWAKTKGVARIAVAVLIEGGGVNGNETTGGQAAAPVAQAVMQAYLRGHPG